MSCHFVCPPRIVLAFTGHVSDPRPSRPVERQPPMHRIRTGLTCSATAPRHPRRARVDPARKIGGMSELAPSLVELAGRYGIATGYSDWSGRYVLVSET